MAFSAGKGPYVPGQPGALWSERELLATRAHLEWIMRNTFKAMKKVPAGPVSALEGVINNWQTVTGYDIVVRYHQKPDENPPGIRESSRLTDAVMPNIAKFVRLAFHDCIKDSVSGGCNGCLNFREMGVEGKGEDSQGCHKQQTCPKDSLEKRTDNNNLLWVARVLELLYTKASPPFATKSKKFRLPLSLRDSGKSRADLWAFAGLVAIELASQHNNNFCTNRGGGLCPGQFDERSPPCNYTMPTLTFKTGRRDCIPDCTGADSFYGFCSTANEEHANPLGNGDDVTKYFKDSFNFTPRESIALLGAHTLGHANEQISGFRHYPWTSGGFEHVLNNNYYKQMANLGMYRIAKKRSHGQPNWCNLDVSTFIGDEHGNPIKSFWISRSQWQNNDGGAWVWNPFGLRCDPRKCNGIPNAQKSKASCCRHFGPSGLDCLNSGKHEGKCKQGFCNPATDRHNCAMPRFMQSSYLNVDMGLFLKFNTDGTSGRPTGCSGLNKAKWLRNWSRFSGLHGCPLNDAMDADGSKMHEIVEEFANDNQQWVNEFTAVFQKMQENGYTSLDLSPAPNNWQGLSCNAWNCKPYPRT